MPLQLLRDDVSPTEWSALARNFADFNLYQTWAYGQHRASDDGATISRAIAMRDGRIMALAQVRIKRIPLLRTGIAYVHGGPLWQCQGCRPQDLRDMIGILHSELAEDGGLTLRVAPTLSESNDTGEILTSAGLAPSGQPDEQTIVLDLTPSLAELRQKLAQKWRNCLNYAERQSLTVTSDTSEEQMARFAALYEKMWAKKRFASGVSMASYCTLQSQLAPGERLQVFIALADGIPVAGHVSITLGNSCVYLLGASNDIGRQRKAAYLLQWKTIEHARQLGARWYDLGGIDAAGNPGVYHFKSGLGGREVSRPRDYNTPRRGPARVLLPLAEAAYRRLRRLQKQNEAVQA